MLNVLRSDFWKQFCSGFLIIAVTVVQLYAGLPIVTYEAPTYTNGASIGGFAGWQVQNGQATVVNGEGFESSQALKLHKGSSQDVVVTRDLSIPVGENIAFIDFRIKPVAVPNNGTATSTIIVNGTHLSFVKDPVSGTGVLYVLDGNDDHIAQEEWIATAHRQALAGALSYEAQDWIRVTIRQDYTGKVWDLYVDGVLYAADMGFYQRGSTLQNIKFYGAQVGDVYLDNLQSDETNMLFTDADKDGIPDSYETANGMNTALNDRAVTNGSGKTHLGAYLESLFPGYNSNGSSASQAPGGGSTATIPPITILPEHEVVGSLGGKFEVGGDGSGQYTIPIDLPAGTGGMVPQISLAYSSNGGNGIMGVGWDLSGFQRITRGPATKARDGFIDPVDFDDSDRFYLDGERLVAIKNASGQPATLADYGKDGTEYRTENNSFARIISHGTLGSGPHHWTVETKAGLKFSFGDCTTSCVQNPSGQGALVWSLNKAEDSVGNYYEIAYEQDGGQPNESIDYRPSEVRYTGNAAASVLPYSLVKFVYENRPDPSNSFVAGIAVHSQKRLSSIEVRYASTGSGDGNLCYKYDLDYLDEDTVTYPNGWDDFVQYSQTGRSLLEKITKVAADGTALPPTAIEWQRSHTPNSRTAWLENTPYLFERLPSWGDGSNTYSMFMDVDGDGLQDRVDHHNYATAEYGLWVRKNNGSGFEAPVSWLAATQTEENYPVWGDGANTFSQFVDINGDGLPDRVDHHNYDTNEFGLWVRPNTGSGFGPRVKWLGASKIQENYPSWGDGTNTYSTFIDMNADGLPDRVDHYNYDTNETGIWVRLNNGSGFDSRTKWLDVDRIEEGYPVWGTGGSIYSMFVDMNGDRLPDRVDHHNYQTNEYGLWVRLNTGSGFGPRTKWFSFSSTWQANMPMYRGTDATSYAILRDMNGDSLPDRVSHKNFTTNTDGFWVALNNGAGFDDPQEWYNPSYLYDNYPTWGDGAGTMYTDLRDVNGDSLPDRISHYNYITSEYGFWVQINTGIGFRPLEKWFSSPYTGENYPVWTSGGYGYSDLVDMNGDGLVDRLDHYDYVNGGYKLLVTLGRGNGFGVDPATNPKLPFQDRIASLTDGFGAKIKIEYLLINSPEHVENSTEPVYVKGDAANMPAGHLAIQDSRWVVSRYAEQDGLGGWRWKRHHYGDIRFDKDNEVPLGFRWIKVVDEQRGHESYTEYSQTYPTHGSITLSESRIANGTVIAKTQGTYAQMPVVTGAGGKIYYPYQSAGTEWKYDLDGTQLSSSSSIQTVDDYGSILNSTVTLTDNINSKTWTTTTVNTYQNITSSSKWHLARLLNASVTKTGTGQPPQTKSTAFTYDGTTGLLATETVQPGHAKAVTTSRTRDAFGNVISTTISAAGMPDRTNTSSYDSLGRFVIHTANALGHTASMVYDQEKALLLESTDANGLRSSFAYDVFGTRVLTTHPDGTQTAEITKRYTGGVFSGISFVRKTETSGTPPAVVYFDAQGRERYAHAVAFDGQTIRTETEYDVLGRKSRVSLPYFVGNTPAGWQSLTYDEVDRVLSTTHPDGSCDCATYSGYTSVMTNRNGQTRTRVQNAREELISVTDHNNVTSIFEYFVDGKAKKATGPGGHIVENAYDIFGNKLTTTDSDTGINSNVYDAYGQVTSTTDAKGQTTSFTYDTAGRPLTKTSPEETVTYMYDNAPGASLGKPASVSSTSGYAESFVYDAYGRTISTSRIIAGETFTGQTWYDVLGRVDVETDAGGLSIRHHYNSRGFEEKITEAYTGTTYWEALEYDASGRLIREELGNGVQTTRTYNQLNGTLKRTQSGLGAVANKHDQEYSWDSLGNLQWRKDHILNLTENFGYDSLNRLTSAQVTGQSANVFTYDSTGNITSKTGTGTYHYGDSSRPHRLTSITKAGSAVRSYTYDANGAITDDGRRNYTWTSFNKVKTIYQASAPVVNSFAGASLWAAGVSDTAFDYDASGDRIRQVLIRMGAGVNNSSTQRITTYVGSYEREAHYNSSNVLWQIRHRHMVGGFLQIKRTETSGQSGITEELSYFLKDHLGSTSSVLDTSGNVVERPSFDAWGKTRNAMTWADVDADIQQLSSQYTNRGYTGHEQLDESGLVHMNGRIYDPEVGRFLSPDPYIQNPEYSQNFNRYTYVLNNPLSYTDPSGHFFVALFAAVVNAIVSAVVVAAKVILGVGKFIVTNLLKFAKWLATPAQTPGGAFLKGSAISGVKGAASGARGSDLLRGMLVGGITAAISTGVLHDMGANASSFADKAIHTAGHGIVGGVASVAMGGKFQDGFLSSVAGAAAGHAGVYQAFEGTGVWGRTAVAGIIGGTASAIGGGKFANGAYTAAFLHFFNDEVTEAEYWADSTGAFFEMLFGGRVHTNGYYSPNSVNTGDHNVGGAVGGALEGATLGLIEAPVSDTSSGRLGHAGGAIWGFTMSSVTGGGASTSIAGQATVKGAQIGGKAGWIGGGKLLRNFGGTFRFGKKWSFTIRYKKFRLGAERHALSPLKGRGGKGASATSHIQLGSKHILLNPAKWKTHGFWR